MLCPRGKHPVLLTHQSASDDDRSMLMQTFYLDVAPFPQGDCEHPEGILKNEIK